MLYSRNYPFVLLLVSLIFLARAAGRPSTPPRTSPKSKYSKAHSLGKKYDFDPRDGWQNANVSDLPYKYIRNTLLDGGSHNLQHRNTAVKDIAKDKSVNALGFLLKSVKVFMPVTITWYTGHDLENPSCWPDNIWTPTDESFVCALTLQGWTNRPKCFEFLEICNGPKKCIFVRVVDTCAGCKPGSKHVDLTRAAFETLADPDAGILTVSMRPASNIPDKWDLDLWGPKA
ncbi:RlpA-like double-psi beta-barrel-protein domain-containing protein-containing protein [Infundibulicybe gibba]|nr:RlpA-like double-psi beta-barrel-protein domain-containing protein-containing protein [Infundibulicybe gibba]